MSSDTGIFIYDWRINFSVIISLISLTVVIIREVHTLLKNRESFKLSIPASNKDHKMYVHKIPSTQETKIDGVSVTEDTTVSLSFIALSLIVTNTSKRPLNIHSIELELEDGAISRCLLEPSYFNSLITNKFIYSHFPKDTEYNDGGIHEETILSSSFPVCVEPNQSCSIRTKFKFESTDSIEISALIINTPKKSYKYSDVVKQINELFIEN